jgi:hypothetical protein
VKGVLTLPVPAFIFVGSDQGKPRALCATRLPITTLLIFLVIFEQILRKIPVWDKNPLHL